MVVLSWAETSGACDSIKRLKALDIVNENKNISRVSRLHFYVDRTGTRLQRGSVPSQTGGHFSLLQKLSLRVS